MSISENHIKVADAGLQLSTIFVMALAASHSGLGERLVRLELLAHGVLKGYTYRCGKKRDWNSTCGNMLADGIKHLAYYSLPAYCLWDASQAWPRRSLLSQTQWITTFGPAAALTTFGLASKAKLIDLESRISYLRQ